MHPAPIEHLGGEQLNHGLHDRLHAASQRFVGEDEGRLG